MQDENSAADAMSVLDLISLKNIFDDYELPTALLEKSDLLPLSSLVVNPTPDYKQRTRTVSFSFLPLEIDHFQDVKIMQVYSEFNFEVKEDCVSTVERLIIKLNKLLVLGSLGLSDANKVYYRYVHTMGKYDNLSEAEDTLANLFNLVVYSLNVNAKAVESVGLGEQNLEAALAEFMT